jgi:hypothetical protein
MPSQNAISCDMTKVYSRSEGVLDFDSMDAFMIFVLKAIHEHGARAVRVFPPASQVIISFAERIANEVACNHHCTQRCANS